MIGEQYGIRVGGRSALVKMGDSGDALVKCGAETVVAKDWTAKSIAAAAEEVVGIVEKKTQEKIDREQAVFEARKIVKAK